MTSERSSQLSEKLSLSIGTFINTLARQIEASNKRLVELGKPVYTMPEKEVVEACCIQVASHLSQHVSIYKVEQEDIDIFKVSAWLGMILWHRSGKVFHLLDVMSVLNLQLAKVGRSLPFEFIRKIAYMAMHDKCLGHDDFAVGMNGIYLTFRACYKLKVTSPANP